MIRVGVVLSGCGFLDGTEIHEATLVLLFLDRAGTEAICIAPDIDQSDVVNHFTKEATGQRRNALVEASRIGRGNVKDIKNVYAGDLDALIFPGGYGAAKNLCNFVLRGVDCTVNPQVERLIKEVYQAKKPLGFICIAAVIAAKVLGKSQPELTIGNDEATIDILIKMGARHRVCKVDEIAVDENNRIISTPAYMLGPSIFYVAIGIRKLVAEILKMAKR